MMLQFCVTMQNGLCVSVFHSRVEDLAMNADGCGAGAVRCNACGKVGPEGPPSKRRMGRRLVASGPTGEACQHVLQIPVSGWPHEGRWTG